MALCASGCLAFAVRSSSAFAEPIGGNFAVTIPTAWRPALDRGPLDKTAWSRR